MKLVEILDKERALFIETYILSRAGVIESFNLNRTDLIKMADDANVVYDYYMKLCIKLEEQEEID